MFPGVDESVLQNNPGFATLHHTLTTAILNPDGSTKNDTLNKEREATHEALKQYRLTHAKHHLLTRAIATATPPEPKAPPGKIGQARPQTQAAAAAENLSGPLLDLMFLLPPLLDATKPLPPDATALLLSSPPFSDLSSLLPQLAPIISSTLRDSATSLARVANPSTNPSFLHKHVPSLAQDASAKRAQVHQSRANLVRDRIKLSGDVARLLAKEYQAIGLLVRTLESKHGVAARSLELRAAEAALQARHADVDARLVCEAVRADVYSPEAVGALRNYEAHLRDARMRVEENIKVLEMELEAYGVGVEGKQNKEGRMREMARKWNDMEQEIEDVRKDLDRLET